MSLPYVPGHIIDECHDRRRQGDSVASLASRLGLDPDDLATLLGEPQWKSASVEPAADGFDLWAADRLQAQL